MCAVISKEIEFLSFPLFFANYPDRCSFLDLVVTGKTDRKLPEFFCSARYHGNRKFLVSSRKLVKARRNRQADCSLSLSHHLFNKENKK